MANKVFLLTRFTRLNARNRFSSSSHSSISKTMETDQAFSFSLFSSFILDLEDLDRSLGDGSISLQWCSKAMSLVKKMHLHFLQCFERLLQLPSSQQDPLTLTEEYMRASLELLDLCNVLKSSVSRFFRWGLTMPFPTRRLSSYERRLISDETAIAMMDEEEEEKEKQRESIFRLQIDVRRRGGGVGVKVSYKVGDKVKTTKLKGHCNLADEVWVMQGAISMISSLVHCTIMQRAPVRKKEEEVVCYYRDNLLNSFSGSIRSLVSSFMERLKVVREDRVAILTEVQMIDSANSDYCNTVLKAAGCSNDAKDEVFDSLLLETLKRRSVALREGLELFESVVDEVFDDVTEGRKRVISSLVDSETLSLV